jgi:purine-binding chemotaxis protein CheW
MTHDLEGTLPESNPDDVAEAPAPREGVPYLGFYLGPELYGLPLARLREVARLTRLRRIPGVPAGVAGLVNLRGEIICALDARAILGLAPWMPSDAAVLIALRSFDYPVGLVVDSIADIFSIDPEEIAPPPSTWLAERAAYFVGTTTVRLGSMGLLDLDRVVTR